MTYRRDIGFFAPVPQSSTAAALYQPGTIDPAGILANYRYTGEIDYFVADYDLQTAITLYFSIAFGDDTPVAFGKKTLAPGEASENLLTAFPRGRREPPLKFGGNTILSVAANRDLAENEMCAVFGGASETGELIGEAAAPPPTSEPASSNTFKPIVLDAGDAFRYRFVDFNYSWNNVNTFSPTTTDSAGSLKMGTFTLKNWFGVRLYGGLSSGNRGSTTFVKLLKVSDDTELINVSAAQLIGQDLGNGFPGRVGLIDTSAYTGVEAYLLFEATNGYQAGTSAFVGIANEIIIY